jgi:predicted phage-related endonuclease
VRDRWERDSIHSVGASELAAILGADARRGALSIYAAKVGKKLDEPERSWLAFGRRVEGAILDGFADRTGRKVRHNAAADIERFYHPDQRLLSATPDGFVDEPAPDDDTIEAKAVGFMKREEWHEEPPIQYVIQAQAQMACAVRRQGHLVALMGGIYISDPVTLTPNAEFISLALEAVERFWWHVQNQRPPEADGKPETRDAIRRLWPTDDGTAIALNDDDLDLVHEWDVAKARLDAATDHEEELQNMLRARMGDATLAYLPDRSSLVCKASHVDDQKCGCGAVVRRGHIRRQLKRWFPQDLKRAIKASRKEK